MDLVLISLRVSIQEPDPLKEQEKAWALSVSVWSSLHGAQHILHANRTEILRTLCLLRAAVWKWLVGVPRFMVIYYMKVLLWISSELWAESLHTVLNYENDYFWYSWLNKSVYMSVQEYFGIDHAWKLWWASHYHENDLYRLLFVRKGLSDRLRQESLCWWRLVSGRNWSSKGAFFHLGMYWFAGVKERIGHPMWKWNCYYEGMSWDSWRTGFYREGVIWEH